jgi:hypothetical protein
MRRIKQAQPSAALIVAVIALVAALGGGAVAGVAVTSLNKQDKKQVKKISKKQGKKQGKKQAKKQIGKQFPVESSQIADGAVGGPQIASNSIDDSKLTDLDLFGDSFVTAPVDDQTDKEFGPGQAAAPKVPLFSKGQLSVYGKCFETQTPETYATVSVETSAAGAILGATDTPDPEPSPPGSSSAFKTRTAWLDGDPEFLDPDTDELDRTVGLASVGSGSFQSRDLTRVSFSAMSPDGTAVNGLLSLAVGTAGVYGSEQTCLFGGFGIG